MKHPNLSIRQAKGSALLTVVMLTAMMAILTASMLSYTISERRGNERNRLILHAKNMAENISVYAAEQLTTKLYRLRSATPMAFMSGTNQIYMPPSHVLNTQYTTSTGMEVRAGLISTTGLSYIDPAVAANASNPNIGLSVSTSRVPIISKAAATHPSLGTVTAYTQQDMEVAMIPLFQFGIFYNMDLEFFPGQDMTIMGPVHTNGRLMARGEVGGAAVVNFSDRVTAAEGLFANGLMKTNYITRTGTTNTGDGGTGAVNYRSVSGTVTNLKSSAGVWRDHRYGTTAVTTSTLSQFKTFATTTYTGNVRTNVHGVTKLELPSIGTYRETDDPTTTAVDERNNGRQLIEPPAAGDSAAIAETKISRKAGLYIIVNPDDDARIGTLPNETTVRMLPRSYRCWLNSINTDGSHTLYEVLLPGQPSYGYNNNGTPMDFSDDTMYQNNTQNRFTNKTAVGHNQVLRIPASGRTCDNVNSTYVTAATYLDTTGYATTGGSGSAFPAEAATPSYPAEAYFFDLRRANNNRGSGSNLSSGSIRSSNNYVPRAIAKIDFDLTRFKMMVARTMSYATSASVYDVGVPTATNWSRSIYNPSGAAATIPLGVGATFTTFPTLTTPTDPDPYMMFYAPASPIMPAVAVTATDLCSSTSTNVPWFDGITIYLQSVDAEVRSKTSGVVDRLDSGVRLWNGRGPVVSLSGSTYPNKTGFTFVTNDAVYIMGHFNANGSVNATPTSTTNPGGYSARYPDSTSEMLACVMADAITILSQPVFSTATTPYTQTNGWNDAVSGYRVTNSSWSSTWRSSQPSGSNNYEGLGTTAIRPGAMPMSSTPGATGSTRTTKLPTVNTEISCALLMGLIPSNHNPTGLTAASGQPSPAANAQYSGGAHNFPRLLEDWHNDMGSGTNSGLFIRGSMVALFESRVAMEPWNIRVYQAPDRYWGLHESLRSASHDVPLEPIVLNSRRMGFKEITPAQYATMKATIEALPH
jgi:hypothetical protein